MAREITPWTTAEQELRYTVLGALKAQEFERNMVSKFLHDSVGQNLTALGLQLDLVRMDLESVSPETCARIAEIQKVLETMMEQVREYSYELNPSAVERAGLRAGARPPGRPHPRRVSPAHCGVNVDPSLKLDPKIASALYQIAQEAVENAVQHSSCSAIEIAVKSTRTGSFSGSPRQWEGIRPGGYPGGRQRAGAAEHGTLRRAGGAGSFDRERPGNGHDRTGRGAGGRTEKRLCHSTLFLSMITSWYATASRRSWSAGRSSAWWARRKTAPTPCNSARRSDPDLVLMDIGLPGMNGIEATTELLRHCPARQGGDPLDVRRRELRGERHPLRRARFRAEEGLVERSCWTRCARWRAAARTSARRFPTGCWQRIQRGDLDTHDRSPLESLSPRELQVLRLVAEGKTSKDIAVLLDLGLQTVRSYRKTMMKKLGVNNVAGLTQLALAAGITHWNKPDADTLG